MEIYYEKKKRKEKEKRKKKKEDMLVQYEIRYICPLYGWVLIGLGISLFYDGKIK